MSIKDKKNKSESDMSESENDNNQRKSAGFVFFESLLTPTGLSIVIPLVVGIVLSLAVINLSGSDNKTESSEEVAKSEPDYIKPLQMCIGTGKGVSEKDMEVARIAWKYFENNYQPKTGLVNAADRYPSTTMWDTGSALAATISAHDLGLIDQKDFDDRIVSMLGTLQGIKLFNDEAPNKAYHTILGEMVDYRNKPSPDGIGVSTLDLARLLSWLNILSCVEPKFSAMARNVMTQWNYCNLVNDGQMYGLARDSVTKKVKILQEGRLGYEQYAGKILEMFGFDQSISATYKNQYSSYIDIHGIPIAYDNRDPRKLGAYNYVVTESYAMDVIENGWDNENKTLTDNIFKVQEKHWNLTGVVTAVSEDNVDRKPYFIYNTIFASGSPWNAITDTGKDMEHMKTLSTKAAWALNTLYPDENYGKVLADSVGSVYNPDRGWYSGIYENGQGYNKAISANTNGVILSGILFKKYGSLNQLCKNCDLGIKLTSEFVNKRKNRNKCLPMSKI